MKRCESLDILRGLTVALMIVVNNGAGSVRFHSLTHSSWEGCTLCDLVFPTFLFCVGVSMAFSLARFDRLSMPAARKIGKRGLLIFMLGLLLNAFPFYPLSTDPSLSFGENWSAWASHLRIMGVLQRIALCYVFASVLVLLLRKTRRIVAAVIGLSVLYTGILLVFGTAPGPFSYEGNAANEVNTFLLGKNHVYKVFSRADGTVCGFDPEGILDTLSAICTTLLGFLSGRLLRRASVLEDSSVRARALQEVALKLYMWSAVCMALGQLLSTWIPMVKKIWTPSYMLYAAGITMFMLALMIYLVDVKGWGRFFYPFKAMGMNPLALYCLSWVLAVTLTGIIGFDKHAVFGKNEFTSLLYSLLFVSVHLIVGVLLYRKKIFIKI